MRSEICNLGEDELNNEGTIGRINIMKPNFPNCVLRNANIDKRRKQQKSDTVDNIKPYDLNSFQNITDSHRSTDCTDFTSTAFVIKKQQEQRKSVTFASPIIQPSTHKLIEPSSTIVDLENFDTHKDVRSLHKPIINITPINDSSPIRSQSNVGSSWSIVSDSQKGSNLALRFTPTSSASSNKILSNLSIQF